MVLAIRRPELTKHDLLLSARGVTVRYGPLLALDAVDLDVFRGEVVALAGENGAGKSTLVRCIAGDMAPTSGQISMLGKQLTSDFRAAARNGIAVVWQDLALCDNLDVAANLLLGRERRRLMFSEARFHAHAAALLANLGIPISDTTRELSTLSGGQRQLVAVARAMRDDPQLLILDEPTASLGVVEGARVEALASRLRQEGTTILLVSHDIDQMFRLADRIVVLRHGRLVADLDPADSHPDDVLALVAGQELDASARTQLSRLHGLSDQLASADPSSSLSLILSALGAALGAEQLCIHLVDGDHLRTAAAVGLPTTLARSWSEIPLGPAGGPIGLAAVTGQMVVEPDVRSSVAWTDLGPSALVGRINSYWSVPFSGSTGVTGVVTVLRRTFGPPPRDELDLVNLYAGYASSAVERDRLLTELTARNRVLETIREILETLAGPVPLVDGLVTVLHALRQGLEADEVSLVSQPPGGPAECRAWVSAHGDGSGLSARLVELAETLLAEGRDGRAHLQPSRDGGWQLSVRFATPGGPAGLLARWYAGDAPPDGHALIEDTGNSLGLALEREESERAHREATTLRRTQELQRLFLSRLSHELRTPLTAIRGYASSLMQPDVTWDPASHDRFLVRIAAESARLGRLVDDLLDFSAIESSILRLQPDWCDLALVLDAARACLAPAGAELVEIRCPADLPPVWADHDRLEQVFVNLLDNALRHNPPGTRVTVAASTDSSASADPLGRVVVTVADDGVGIPGELATDAFVAGRVRRSPTAGAGLGLSIAKGIIEAHGGQIRVERLSPGTRFVIRLPVEHGDQPGGEHG